MEEKQLVPKRRFKEFEGEWKKKNFDEEIELYSGLTYSPNDVQQNGTFVLRSSNVQNGEIVSADDVYVDSEVVNSSNVREGDIIVVVRNGSRSLIGKHAKIKKSMDKTVIGAFMTGVRSNQPNFINALLDTRNFKREIDKNLGATINQITNGMFKSMSFIIPSVKEQKKIGEFFKALDERIANQERKIAKVKALKAAYLTEMFPQEGKTVPKRRFKGFEDDWRRSELAKLTDLYVGKSFTSSVESNGKYTVMDMGSVSQEGNRLIHKKTNLKRDILLKEDLVMPKDDIGGGNIIGKTAYINQNNRYVLGDHVYRLRFQNNYGLFMHYCINSKPINKNIRRKATGSAQLGIIGVNVLNTIVAVPSLAEQQKIGEFFKNIDNQIEMEEKKLDKLQKMKEAYLEEMFV